MSRSDVERRGERSARTLCVLYGLRLLEMAAFEWRFFWNGKRLLPGHVTAVLHWSGRPDPTPFGDLLSSAFRTWTKRTGSMRPT